MTRVTWMVVGSGQGGAELASFVEETAAIAFCRSANVGRSTGYFQVARVVVGSRARWSW